MTQQQQQRPLGITILAILGIIGGVMGLLGGCGAIAGGALVGALGAQAGVGAVAAGGGLLGLLGIVTLAMAVGWIAFGIGAWTLKPWAWMLGLVLVGISIVVALVTVLSGGDFGSQLLGLVIDGVIVYYLMTPEVKQAFGRA
jgi:hypothetical protein